MEYNFESEREMGVETKTGFKPIWMIGKGSGIKGRKTPGQLSFCFVVLKIKPRNFHLIVFCC